MANELGTTAKYRHSAAIVPTVARLYLVETATPGVFDWSETSGTNAVLAETATAGVYDWTETPGAAAVGTMYLIGTAGRIY